MPWTLLSVTLLLPQALGAPPAHEVKSYTQAQVGFLGWLHGPPAPFADPPCAGCRSHHLIREGRRAGRHGLGMSEARVQTWKREAHPLGSRRLSQLRSGLWAGTSS